MQSLLDLNGLPSIVPSSGLSNAPSKINQIPPVMLTCCPSKRPSDGPSDWPLLDSSMSLSTVPSAAPSSISSRYPSSTPFLVPSLINFDVLSSGPSFVSSLDPSGLPLLEPRSGPSDAQSNIPLNSPSSV